MWVVKAKEWPVIWPKDYFPRKVAYKVDTVALAAEASEKGAVGVEVLKDKPTHRMKSKLKLYHGD